MFYGRNEECGLRCVYHGWKFDRHGNCTDMPSEPAGTPLQAKVKIVAYPVHEKGGVIWTYMGDKAKMPEPPDYEWTRAPETHRFVSKTWEDCNWLQAMEGGLDTAHSSFVHNEFIGNNNSLRNQDRAPRIDVERTDYGYYYVSTRGLSDGSAYVRLYHYVMPNQQMRSGAVKFLKDGGEEDPHAIPKMDGHLWVPVDDEHTYVYNWTCSADPDVPLPRDYVERWESFMGRGKDDMVPWHLQTQTQYRQRLPHRPRHAAQPDLFRDQGAEHPGLCLAGGNGAYRRPLEGVSRHLRPGHRRHAAPAA